MSLGYRDSHFTRDLRPDGEGLRAGDRAPDAPGLNGPDGPCRLFDLLRGPRVTLLGFGESWRSLIDACIARFTDGVKGYVIAATAACPGSYADVEGHARAAYQADTLFIIRPDNYIGLATMTADTGEVIAYLKTILP